MAGISCAEHMCIFKTKNQKSLGAPLTFEVKWWFRLLVAPMSPFRRSAHRKFSAHLGIVALLFLFPEEKRKRRARAGCLTRRCFAGYKVHHIGSRRKRHETSQILADITPQVRLGRNESVSDFIFPTQNLTFWPFQLYAPEKAQNACQNPSFSL